MPLVAAAVCPHPPLLVPEIAAGAAGELDDLRSACDEAVGRLARSGTRRLLIVGTGERGTEHFYPVRGSFAPWGVPIEVGLGAAEGSVEALPLGVLMGIWLVNRSFHPENPVSCGVVSVPREDPLDACARLGARLVGDGPVALLVMGDGSACRGPASPGYSDPRADRYDRTVAAALAAVDTAALRALDPVLSGELSVAGRAAWQVLAGAAESSGPGMKGELLYDAAPYGVGYFVATWESACRESACGESACRESACGESA